MKVISATQIVTAVGFALVALQVLQLWREGGNFRRSRNTVLMLLLGCDLIIAPWLGGVAPIIPVVIAIGLVATMMIGLFARNNSA